MKSLNSIFSFLFLLVALNCFAQNSMYDNSGELILRLTSIERDNLKSPKPGTMIFNTTTGTLNIYNAGWKEMKFADELTTYTDSRTWSFPSNNDQATNNNGGPNSENFSNSAGSFYQTTSNKSVQLSSAEMLNAIVNEMKSRSIYVGNSRDFRSITQALNYIMATHSTEHIIISVDPGIYIEETIDLTQCPYVSIKGAGSDKTTIRPSSNNIHLFIMGQFNEISSLRIEGTGDKAAAVFCHNSGDFSNVSQVVIQDCGYGIIIESDQSDHISVLNVEETEFINCRTHTVWVATRGNGMSMLNMNKGVVISDDVERNCFKINGKNAVANISGICFHSTSQDKKPTQIFALESGGVVNSSEIHIFGYSNPGSDK